MHGLLILGRCLSISGNIHDINYSRRIFSWVVQFFTWDIGIGEGCHIPYSGPLEERGIIIK